jgi:hypothetical protein
MKQFNPQLYQLLMSLKDERYRVEASRSGLPTLIYRNDGQDFYIHSKFKPDAEAIKIVQKCNLEADHIIILGLGLGYHLDLIMNHKAENTRVLLVEPDLEIVKHSLNTINWDALMAREDFFYNFGTDLNLLSATVQQTIDFISFDKVEWIELPSEVRFNKSFFAQVQEKIDNEIRTLLYDFKTRLAEEAMVPRNILKNIDGLLNTRPVKALKDCFAGKPGFIVSAGPSLDKNILHLKRIKDRAVIICVDTALKPLLKRGIHPHFTITADPSYKNYLHLQGTEQEIEYFLLADTGVSTQVYKDFDRHIFSVSLGKPIVKMIEQNIGQMGELEAWGSVISLALNFAIYLGLEPIVFMGQDFSFTDMRNHCRGTSWEESWLHYHRDLDLIQRMEKHSISGIAKVSELKDIYGNNTMSSDKLLLYKNYLTKNLTSLTGKRFINATEGGVLTEIEQMPLHKVMKEFVFDRDPIDFSRIGAVPTLGNNQSKKQLLKFLKAKVSFFKKYLRKLNESTDKLASHDSLETTALKILVEEAERIKDQLYMNVQNGELVEMWTQAPIYDFLKRSRKLLHLKTGFSDAYGQELATIFTDYFEKLKPITASIIDSLNNSIEILQ